MSVTAYVRHAGAALPQTDWRRLLETVLRSRALDALEETRLLPERQILYQFSARGHDVTQALLAQELTGAADAVTVYYRSRALLLGLGLTLEEALASTMMRTGSVSAGRDIGVIFNLPRREGVCVLPACGGVGSQYTPAVGWAHSILYRTRVLRQRDLEGSIAVAHGGDASVATSGFWAALNIATTERLPLLFFIEDNGYGISVRSSQQTPGGNIAANLSGFRNLRIFEASGSDPHEAAYFIHLAVSSVRESQGPTLLRLTVPRLSGHSGQDTQSYRSPEELEADRQRDPLVHLRRQLVPGTVSEGQWQAIADEAQQAVLGAFEQCAQRPLPAPAQLRRFVFTESAADGAALVQSQGGMRAAGFEPEGGSETPLREGPRINMLTAIRRTLEHELTVNPRVVVFGEDVGAKGGVHAATLGLQQKFGSERVFDTSLSEEGIIGRAVGLALAGLVPVPEIQFRKYADPAAEQLNDCGTMRWRTANRFAAPMVVRMPGGFFKCGDPWHSQCNEAQFAHAIGWRVAMPSNAEDAVGLLRSALRGNDPTLFFEHRAMLDAAWARRPYPGDDFLIPFGRARRLREGRDLTVVTWGAMVERCEAAAQRAAIEVELLDLRTLIPWDRAAVLASVARTHRCLIVHEDNVTVGFGAEIAATIAQAAFFELEAPIERLAMPDVPSPHAPVLLEAALPSIEGIVAAMHRIASL